MTTDSRRFGRQTISVFAAVLITLWIGAADAFAQGPEQTNRAASEQARSSPIIDAFPEVSDASPAASAPVPATAPSADLFRTGPSRTVMDLFAPLPGDFRQMGSSQNWMVVAIGGAGALAAHSLDSRVASMTWPAATAPVMSPGAIVGAFEVQLAGAIAVYAAGRINDSSRVARIGAELFRAQVVSEATSQVLKLATGRTRPDGTSMSFPSGHSASMFATATVLQSELGWKVGVPAYAAAAWVAASRVEGRRHYLSDVVAGATVGIIAGRSVTVGVGNARFSLGPMAVPGGMGVSFTKISKP